MNKVIRRKSKNSFHNTSHVKVLTNFGNDQSLEEQISPNLLKSSSVTLITGYIGLGAVCEFINKHFQKWKSTPKASIRLIIGYYPHTTLAIKESDYIEELYDGLLDQQLSFRNSVDVVRTCEAIRAGYLKVRIYDDLHAKLFYGNAAAFNGSANFSKKGLLYRKGEVVTAHPKGYQDYSDLCEIGEDFWSAGRPFDDELLEVLERLLQVVNYDEVLAWIIQELTQTARFDVEVGRSIDISSIWAHQRGAALQALVLLQQYNFVLFADATGSGKTLQVALTLRILYDHYVMSTGYSRQAPLVIVPNRNIREYWMDQTRKLAFPIETASYMLMSRDPELNANSRKAIASLSECPLLGLDECHQLLNKNSKRSKRLSYRYFPPTLAASATPIARDKFDFLNFFNLLDKDSLNQEEEAFLTQEEDFFLTALKTNSEYTPSLKFREKASKIYSGFTIRRSPRELNFFSEQFPEEYQKPDGSGRYKYPEVEIICEDTSNLRKKLESRIFEEISKIVSEMPMAGAIARSHEISSHELANYSVLRKKKRNLRNRRRSFFSLIQRAMYESSLTALQFAIGSDQARDWKKKGYKLLDYNDSHEGFLQRWEHAVNNYRGADHKLLQDDYRQDEICLERIASLIKRSGPVIDRAHAEIIAKISKKHDRLIVFFNYPVSKKTMNHLLHGLSRHRILTDSDEIKKELDINSNRDFRKKRIIALASNSLAESVNLQAAQAIIHIGCPGTVRINEQRLGRIYRFDSPYDKIYCYYLSSEKFTGKRERRYAITAKLVSEILGGPELVPEEFVPKSEENYRFSMSNADFKKETQQIIEDGLTFTKIDSAFSGLENLVEGSKDSGFIVSKELFNNFRNIKNRKRSFATSIHGKNKWELICFSRKLDKINIPQLILFRENVPERNLNEIAKFLQKELNRKVRHRAISEESAQLLNKRMVEIESYSVALSNKAERIIISIKNLANFCRSAGNEYTRLEALEETLASGLADLEWVSRIWWQKLNIEREEMIENGLSNNRIQYLEDYLKSKGPDFVYRKLLETFSSIKRTDSIQLIGAIISC